MGNTIPLALKPHVWPAFQTKLPIAVFDEHWEDKGVPGSKHEFGMAIN